MPNYMSLVHTPGPPWAFSRLLHFTLWMRCLRECCRFFVDMNFLDSTAKSSRSLSIRTRGKYSAGLIALAGGGCLWLPQGAKLCSQLRVKTSLCTFPSVTALGRRFADSWGATVQTACTCLCACAGTGEGRLLQFMLHTQQAKRQLQQFRAWMALSTKDEPSRRPSARPSGSGKRDCRLRGGCLSKHTRVLTSIPERLERGQCIFLPWLPVVA